MLVPSHFIAIVNGISTQTDSSAFLSNKPSQNLETACFLESGLRQPSSKDSPSFQSHVGFNVLQFHPTLLYENVKVPLDDGNRSSAHFRVHTFRTDQIP